MIEAIVNGLFNLIAMLGNLITAPLVAGISALIPGLGNVIFNIRLFLSKFIYLIPIILNMAFIPREAVVMLFDFYIVLYSIYLVQITYKLIIKLYNYFKF